MIYGIDSRRGLSVCHDQSLCNQDFFSSGKGAPSHFWNNLLNSPFWMFLSTSSLMALSVSGSPGRMATAISCCSKTTRSEERLVGKECVSTVEYGWSPYL